MCDMLNWQLQNERATYEQLLATGRNDAIATLLRNRMEREIIKIEGEINGKSEQKNSQCRATVRFMDNVFKALYRFGRIKNRSSNPIFAVPQGARQQKQGITQ